MKSLGIYLTPRKESELNICLFVSVEELSSKG